jgi:RNase H-fold protein (predicted Holliday junction resolvase)
MKKFVLKLLLFILPILLYCAVAAFAIPIILAVHNGPSTNDQINYSFENAVNRNYDLLVLGNSRTYRGLNPEKLCTKSYNFSHDNDSYNQLYYKLKYLDNERKVFKYVILGVDYFQFSFMSNTRNYVYADYLGEGYLNDYDDNILKLKAQYYLGNIDPKKLLLFGSASNIPSLKSNGQYLKPGFAKEGDVIQRNIKRLKIQEGYFKKILQFCKEKKITVFLVMLPTRPNELKSYTTKQIEEFDRYIGKYTNKTDVYFLNYSLDSSYTTSDYTDITHLNESAADRFSAQLTDTLSKIIDCSNFKNRLTSKKAR